MIYYWKKNYLYPKLENKSFPFYIVLNLFLFFQDTYNYGILIKIYKTFF